MQYFMDDTISSFLSNFELTIDTNLVTAISPLPSTIKTLRKNEGLNLFMFLKDFGS